MAALHPSFLRLRLVAHEMGGCSTDSEIAAALGTAQQTVHNWHRRGVSKDGAIKAEARFKCRACWILEGEGPKVLDTRSPVGSASVEVAAGVPSAKLIEQLVDLIVALPGTRWLSVRAQLDALVSDPENRAEVVEELRHLMKRTRGTAAIARD